MADGAVAAPGAERAVLRPDYIADPRLSKVTFTQLKKYLAGACDPGNELSGSIKSAMTRFALATLAEENAISLEALLAPLGPPPPREADTNRAQGRSPSSTPTPAPEVIPPMPDKDDPVLVVQREVSSRATELLAAAEEAARVAAHARAAAETAQRECASWGDAAHAEPGSWAARGAKSRRARAEQAASMAQAAEAAAARAKAEQVCQLAVASSAALIIRHRRR